MVSYEMLREKAYSSGKASKYNELCKLKGERSDESLLAILYSIMTAIIGYAYLTLVFSFIGSNEILAETTSRDIGLVLAYWSAATCIFIYILYTVSQKVSILNELNSKITKKEDEIIAGCRCKK